MGCKISMDQIAPLTAKLKRGHVVMHSYFSLTLGVNYEVLTGEPINTEINVLTDDMQNFLDSCIGDYKFNFDDYSITFTDSRDYVNYLLAIVAL